jgi:hypothetical protein
MLHHDRDDRSAHNRNRVKRLPSLNAALQRGAPHQSPKPGLPAPEKVLVLSAISSTDSSLMLTFFTVLSSNKWARKKTCSKCLSHKALGNIRPYTSRWISCQWISRQGTGRRWMGQANAVESLPPIPYMPVLPDHQ